MKCRVCGKKLSNPELLVDVKDDIGVFYRGITRRPHRNADFWFCKECGMGQLAYEMGDGFYDQYHTAEDAYSKSIGRSMILYHKDFYEKKMKEISEKCDNAGRLLDIGCGEGDLMEIAAQYFEEVEGIESSEKQYLIAEKKGFRVTHGYFDKSWQQKGYSAFVMTQVMEHIDNPREILEAVFDALKWGGTGYIDVPNGTNIYLNSEYYTVFFEHINYWSVQAMTKLLCSIGFSIISIGEIMDGNHIGVIVKKQKRIRTFSEERKREVDKINQLTKQYEIVSIWGAGVKGSIICRFLDHERIRYFFDSNENMEGMYIDGFQLPISKPCREKIQMNDAIIITALEHKASICRQLKEEYDFKGDIVFINS